MHAIDDFNRSFEHGSESAILVSSEVSTQFAPLQGKKHRVDKKHKPFPQVWVAAIAPCSIVSKQWLGEGNLLARVTKPDHLWTVTMRGKHDHHTHSVTFLLGLSLFEAYH